LSETVLLNKLLEENVKISILDLNKEICLNYKKFFNIKNNQSYFKKILDVYFNLINNEENKMYQEALEDSETRN